MPNHSNGKGADALKVVIDTLFSPAIGSGGRRSGREGKNNSGTPRRRAKRRDLGTCKCFSLSAIIKAPGGHGSLLRTRGNMAGKEAEVLDTNSVRLEQHSKRDRKMSDVTFAQGMIREAFPKELYGGYKSAVYAAYRFIAPRVSKRFTERRARAIWDGEARRIDMEEADALRAALLEEAKNETQRLRARLAALDEKIAAFDAVTSRQALEKGSRPSA